MFRLRHRKNARSLFMRFVGSYLSLALLAITIAASMSILLFSGQLRRAEETGIEGKLVMAAVSLQAQLDRIGGMADEIRISAEFMRQYFTQDYEHEQALMRRLKSFESMMPFVYQYYLKYSFPDAVYTGRAKYSSHVFFDYLLEPETAVLLRRMERDKATLGAADGILAYRVPLSVLRTSMDLIVLIPCESLRAYAAELAGEDADAVSLILGGECICGDGTGEHSADLSGGLRILVRHEGLYRAVGETIVRFILILAGAALVIGILSVILSYRNYMPIRRISDHYIGKDPEGDELSRIEQVLDDAVTAYRTSEKRLREMSFLLEDQRKILQGQYIIRILHGDLDADTPQEVLRAAGISLPGLFSIAAVVPLLPGDDMEKIGSDAAGLGTENEMALYAVQEEQRILILLNAADRSLLFSGMNMLSSLFEDRGSVIFSDIADTYAGIAGLADSLSEKTSRSTGTRMQMAALRESVLASQTAEALAVLYETDRSISAEEDAYLRDGMRTEFVREILSLAPERERERITARLTSPLLSSQGEEFLHTMSDVIRSVCEERRRDNEIGHNGALLVNYIEEHCGEYGMSLETLAEVFGMSTGQVRGEIRAETGDSYMDYLKKVRIDKAMEKLKNTDISVAAVGEAVGYSNISYFIRLFREHTGYTPSVWRTVNKG